MHKIPRLLLLIPILYSLLGAAWWNSSWQYRLDMRFDNSGQTEDLVNFPVLVVLFDGRINYADCRSDGGDIRFVDGGGTPELAYEIEEWNPAGTSYIWVKVPKVDGGSFATDSIFMYYGNPSAVTTGNGSAVFDTADGYAAVWHMDDTGTDVGDTIREATYHGRHGINQSSNGESGHIGTKPARGRIGGARDFEANTDYLVGTRDSHAGDYIDCGDFTIPTRSAGPGFTVEAWAKVEDFELQWQRIVAKAGGWSTEDHAFMFGAGNVDPSDPENISRLRARLKTTDNLGYPNEVDSTLTVFDSLYNFYEGDWIYAVYTYDGQYIRFYKNGQTGEVYDKTGDLKMDQSWKVTIGCSWMSEPDAVYAPYVNRPYSCWDGLIDEMRISNVTRSSDWIAAQNKSMKDDDFIIWYDIEPPLNNVSLDATPLSAHNVNFAWSYTGASSSDADTVGLWYRTDRFPSAADDGALAGLYDISVTSALIAGLAQNTRYYFAMFVRDSYGNWSLASTAARDSADTYPVRAITAANYYSNGTGSTDNDTLFIRLSAPVLKDSLPVGTGQADQILGIIGEGTILDATVATPAGADTNELVVSLAATDTMLAHNRSYVAIKDGTLHLGDWWNDGWRKRKKLYFNNMTVHEHLDRFPVLVLLDGARIDYGQLQSGGADLRFVDADGITVLDYEIQDWNAAGTSYVWVTVPEVDSAGTNDYIWMYYGNGSAPAQATGEAAWDSAGFAGVWHLDESAVDGAASITHVDETSTGLDAAQGGNGSISGVLRGGQRFDSRRDSVYVPAGTALSGAAAVTFEQWVRLEGDPAQDACAVCSKQNGDDGDFNGMAFEYTREPYISLYTTSRHKLAAPDPVTHYGWFYLAGTYDGGTVRLYVDGVLKASSAFSGGALRSAARPLYMGRNADEVFNFVGDLDEVRISRTARSGIWIKAQYDVIRDRFISYGVEEDKDINLLAPDTALVTTYNVYNASQDISYATLTQGVALGAAGQTVRVLDNGWYRESIVVNKQNLTLESARDRSAVIDGGGSGSAVSVTANGVTLDGFKFTGGGSGGSAVTVSSLLGSVVKNSIAYGNGGHGFSVGTGNAIYNSVARQNAGTGYVVSGNGTVKNTIADGNGINYSLGGSVQQAYNLSYNGSGPDVGYLGAYGLDPRFTAATDPFDPAYLRVQNTSPAIDAGGNLSAAGVTADILGASRPKRTEFDLGAHESETDGLSVQSFIVTAAPVSAAVGSPVTVTVVAFDGNGDTLRTYDAGVNVICLQADAPDRITLDNGTGLTDNLNGTATVREGYWDNGIYTFDITYTRAYDPLKVRIVNATGDSAQTGDIVWTAGALDGLAVTPESVSVTAGNGFAGDVTVTLFDIYGNVKRNYTGTVRFTTDDGSGTVPADYTFTAGDAGTRTFVGSAFILQTAGSRWVAAEASGTDFTDTVRVAVSPGPLGVLEVTGAPVTVTAGAAFPDITVTARDAYGNVITGYADTVRFSSTDDAAYPENRVPSPGVLSGGTRTYAGSLFGLTTAGICTVTVRSGVVSTALPVTVTVDTLYRIAVEPGASGSRPGETVGGDIPTSGSLVMHVSGYDRFDNYRGGVAADWSLATGSLPRAAGYDFPAGPAVSYEFRPDPLSQGSSGTIRAASGALADTTGLITVIARPFRILIMTTATGEDTTNKLTAYTMTTDDTLILYAASYDSLGQYTGNLPVDWSSTQTSGTFSVGAVNVNRVVFTPVSPGAGTITIDYAPESLQYTSGTVTVEVGDLASIRINAVSDGSRDMPDTALTTDDTPSLWAAGYDRHGNFIANQSAVWTVGGDFGAADLDPDTGTMTVFSPSAPGAGTITAAAGGFTDQVAVSVTVGIPVTVVIRDSAGNAGSEVGAFEIVTGRSRTLYLAGYDARGNYTGEVNGVWSSIETDSVFVYAGTGTYYTFSPTAAGRGYLTGAYGGAVDSTGLVNVKGAVPTQVAITYIGPVITAGVPFGSLVITARDEYDNLTDYAAPAVIWEVQNTDTSRYGYHLTVPADSQYFSGGTLDSTGLNGAFIFVNTGLNQIRVGVVVNGTDTVWSAFTAPFTVLPGAGSRVEIRDNELNRAPLMGDVVISIDDPLELFAGLYDSLGNYIREQAVDWSSSGGLTPAVAVLSDSGLTHYFTGTGSGPVMIFQAPFRGDTVQVTTTHGNVNAFRLSVTGGAGDTVTSNTPFSITVTAVDGGGNTVSSYAGTHLLDWAWITAPQYNADTDDSADIAADGQYLFAGGSVDASGFRMVNMDSIQLRVTESDSGTGRITVYVVDGTGPVMVPDSGYYADADGDGYVDSFAVFFNEDLERDTLLTGNAGFSIIGENSYAIQTAAENASGRSVILKAVNSGAVYVDDEVRQHQDTRGIKTAVYDGGPAVRDVYGNNAAAMTVNLRDKAGPVIRSVVYDNNATDDDLSDDFFIIELSERAVPASGTWSTVSGADIFRVAVNGRIGTDAEITTYDTASFRMTLGTEGAVAVLPSLDTLYIRQGGVIVDMYGNPAPDNNKGAVIHMPKRDKLLVEVANYPNPFFAGTALRGDNGPMSREEYEHRLDGVDADNPFEGNITRYLLNRHCDVEVAVYSPLGIPVIRQVMTAGDDGGREGYNFFLWNGTNDRGRLVEPGSYILVIKAVSDGLRDKGTRKIGVLRK